MAEDPRKMKGPDGKPVIPQRSPDAAAGYMTIFDPSGRAHRKPKIVARECLRQLPGWTSDPEVAAAKREAALKSKPASKSEAAETKAPAKSKKADTGEAPEPKAQDKDTKKTTGDSPKKSASKSAGKSTKKDKE